MSSWSNRYIPLAGAALQVINSSAPMRFLLLLLLLAVSLVRPLRAVSLGHFSTAQHDQLQELRSHDSIHQESSGNLEYLLLVAASKAQELFEQVSSMPCSLNTTGSGCTADDGIASRLTTCNCPCICQNC